MIDFFKGTVTAKDWMFVAAVAGLAAVLGVLFYLFVHGPQQEAMVAMRADLQAREAELVTAEHNAANLAQLQELSRYADELSAQLEERLPNRREFETFLTTLEQTGNRHGLAMKFDPGARRRDQQKETWPYRVTVTGEFHKILRLINDLERYERYVRVDDIDMEYREAGVTEAKFLVSTFRFLEEAPQTAGVSRP